MEDWRIDGAVDVSAEAAAIERFFGKLFGLPEFQVVLAHIRSDAGIGIRRN